MIQLLGAFVVFACGWSALWLGAKLYSDSKTDDTLSQIQGLLLVIGWIGMLTLAVGWLAVVYVGVGLAFGEIQ